MQRGFKLIVILGWALLSFVHAFADEPKSICLVMVVKNDENVIEQCLQSVAEIADCICVCDEGSTDNTLQIIDHFMEQSQIPWQLQQSKGDNIHHIRSFCSQSGRDFLQSLGY